jgi:hypothetical protein
VGIYIVVFTKVLTAHQIYLIGIEIIFEWQSSNLSQKEIICIYLLLNENTVGLRNIFLEERLL